MRFGVFCLLFALVASVYFIYVPDHPPGLVIDESSICYNAYTISQTGRDEYGNSWPLFFPAFGEYKSPTVIYLLAGLFRVTGPGIVVARSLAAALGVLSAGLLGWLTWQMTRRLAASAAVAVIALLTPWLFESSRLVFEVAIYPALTALFLTAVWRASRNARWTWSHVFALAATLTLLTYSYSIGRLLGPLLAVGLALFANRERWPGIVKAWLLYALLLVPLFIFHFGHPEALTGRFKAITYLDSSASLAANLNRFVFHYLANINPSRWLLTGEGDIRDHLQGTGSLLAVSVLLALAGSAIALRRYRKDAWWRFIFYCLLVSPVPASLTANPFPQLRLVAFPVFFLVLTIPAIDWLTAPRFPGDQARGLLAATALVLVVVQGVHFQWLYHRSAPTLWYVFDARFPRKVLAPAIATGERPILLIDEPGKAGYIHALWYGVLTRVDPTALVRLPWGKPLPPGAVTISTEEDCRDCRLIARALNYIVYTVPPYRDKALPPRPALTAFQAAILCENPKPDLIVGEKLALKFLVKNTSNVEWPCLGEPDDNGAVKLRNRWRSADDGAVIEQDAEKRLPYDVEPGDTVGLTMEVTAPMQQGDYLLEVDLVQKPGTWFGERGSASWKLPIKVKPSEL